MELMNICEVYIPTTDENGVVTWGEVTAITRHDPGDQLYEIKTSAGKSVIVTESKSLLIWDSETRKLKETSTPDIKVGDCVPVTGELCKPPVIVNSIDMNRFYNDKFVLNEENGIFIGMFLAKGALENNILKINTEVESLQKFVVTYMNSGNISGNFVINYLSNLIETGNEHVPEEAFVAPIEFVSGLLNGYYSLNAAINRENGTISAKSSCKRLLDGINMLLTRFGIFGSIETVENVYILSIQSQWGQIFAEKITLIDETKQDELRMVQWATTCEYYDTYNNIVLDKIVEINLVDVKDHPKVYDLTIPSTLNFGLANGLQVRDTSQTGYIQRRLIKGLEDLKVEYDMTVRNNKGKIIQFAYGDDGFDSTKAENQSVPLVGMSIEDIYVHYDIMGINDQHHDLLNVYSKGTITRLKKQRAETKLKCQEYIDKMLEARDDVVKKVFKYKNENTVKVPVSFQNLIANIQGQLNLNANSVVDITPLEAFELVEEYFGKLNMLKFVQPQSLFEILYYYYLTPRDLLVVKRFHRKALVLLLETVVLKYKQSIVHPGEMVGVIAGQSLGEPTTQLTLNSLVYESEILVRNSKKEIVKVQIGEFTEEQIKASQKVDYMEDKDTTYAELVEHYEVPCANENGETVWRKIEAVTQHPVINEDGTNTMLKVITKGNREIIATKAKSFLQLVDGKIEGVNGKDLRVGDYLPVSKRPLEYCEIKQLNLRTVLPATEYVYGSELEKAKEVMFEHHWWSKYANKHFTVPHTRSDSLLRLLSDEPKPSAKSKSSVNIKPNCVYMKLTNNCNYEIPENIELDYDFGYFVGAYCAEGCMTSHQISIANNNDNYLLPIQRLCEKYNITTKVYTHKDKIQEGWMSQDIRIYNTVLCRILSTLCGKLSHNKKVSDKIVFSNRECILGFLDAYIGGDGYVNQRKRIVGTKRSNTISMTSVSSQLLLDVQIMLKNLDITSKMGKLTKVESNNRGSKNIKQCYDLVVSNKQAQKLAELLNLTIEEKQKKAKQLLNETFKYEYNEAFLTVPNIVNGELIMEDRNGKCPDMLFDEIVSIEEVPNTTNYAYDLTVEETRNFDCYNGLCLRDTFHLSGVASKSNVTRGVPRIEEILRLTKNPKNPSLTVHMKTLDEADKDKAAQYANMLEHTKLVDVIKSFQIYFDPDDKATNIEEDRLLMEQYYEFENWIADCDESQVEGQDGTAKSKWIVRMELDAEALLDKNITMDDIHFAITNSYDEEISCVYSDFNMKNLVFRIRLNSNALSKAKSKTKGVTVETLDQSDDIYLLRNFQDNVLNNVVLRGVHGIKNVLPRKLQNYVVKEDGKYNRKDVWVLDTTGTNLMEVLSKDFVDGMRTYSNDIKEMFDVLGIEAARQVVYNEFVDVMEFSDVYINYHHLSLLADRMTSTINMVSIFRSGILNDDIGPISKSTFEVHTEVLLNASRHAEFDHMRGVSASVMMGQHGYFGTGAFNLTLDMKAIETQEDVEVDMKDNATEIEKMFGFMEDKTDICSKNNIEIVNNIAAIKQEDVGCVDDDYDMGF
jgi:DNA-directed RNA polymerase beta' subunit